MSKCNRAARYRVNEITPLCEVHAKVFYTDLSSLEIIEPGTLHWTNRTIRELVSSANLSTTDAARRLNMAPAQLREYLNGDHLPTVVVFERILSAFGYDLEVIKKD